MSDNTIAHSYTVQLGLEIIFESELKYGLQRCFGILGIKDTKEIIQQ